MDLTHEAQGLFKEIFGSGLLGDLVKLLSENPQTAYPTAWDLVQTIYNNVMVPIALGLMVIWFLVKFMEKSTLEQATYEQALMLFVKLLIAKFLIDYGLQLFAEMWSLGLSLVREFTQNLSPEETTFTVKEIYELIEENWGSLSGGAMADLLKPYLDPLGSGSYTREQLVAAVSDKDLSAFLKSVIDSRPIIPMSDLKEMWEMFSGSAWNNKMGWDSIGVYIQLLVPWLVTLIIRACAYFIVYSRVIEMFLRMAGAPIALSDFMSEGMQGAGWRYLKNFFAVCLQGLLIVVIVRIYSIVILDVIVGRTGWELILAHLAVGFAAIALMFKSLTLAKEFVGTA